MKPSGRRRGELDARALEALDVAGHAEDRRAFEEEATRGGETGTLLYAGQQ